MDNDRSYLYLRNLMANGVGGILLSLIVFFATPMLIAKLGSEAFALFKISMSTIVSYVLLFDLGMGISIKRRLGKAINTKDVEYSKDILGVGVIYYGTISCIVFIIVGVCALIIPSFLQVSSELRIPFIVLIISAGVYVCGNFFYSLINSVFVVLSRYDIVQGGAICGRFLLYFSPIFILSFYNIGLWAVIISVLLSALIPLLLLFFIARFLGVYSGFRISFTNVSLMREMLSFGVAGMFILIGPLVINQSQPIIITKLLDAQSTVDFSVILLLFSTFSTIVNITASSIYPIVLKKHSEDGVEISCLFLKTIFRSLYILSIFIFPLWLMGDIFLSEWIAPSYARLYGVLNIVLLACISIPITMVSNYVLNACGEIKLLAYFSVIMAILSISMSIYFLIYTDLKLYGVALGLTVPYILLSIASFLYATYQLRIHNKIFILLKYVGCIFIDCLIAYVVNLIIKQVFVPESLLSVFVCSGIIGSILAIANFYLILQKSDRDSILAILKKIYIPH